jgi:hypothetical protein
MGCHRWKWLLVIVCGVPLVVWGCDRATIVAWVGTTDLMIEFEVVDAQSGDPVPGARVEVQSQGGFYEERDKREFVLLADADGVARKECHKSMCYGTESGLRFTDTFAVHLPWWRYRVIAAGYHASEWADLDLPEFQRAVQRAGPGQHKLVVRVSLSKKHAE